MDITISNEISAISSLVTALVACIALVISIIEYKNHLKREKAHTLSSFNERYANDKNIGCVTRPLTEYLDDRKNEEEIENASRQFQDLGLYDIEMFMKFFEEVEHSIIAGALNQEEIRYMLSYYALAAAETKRFKDEINNDDWRVFRNFIVRMKRIKPLDKETISKLNNL